MRRWTSIDLALEVLHASGVVDVLQAPCDAMIVIDGTTCGGKRSEFAACDPGSAARSLHIPESGILADTVARTAVYSIAETVLSDKYANGRAAGMRAQREAAAAGERRPLHLQRQLLQSSAGKSHTGARRVRAGKPWDHDDSNAGHTRPCQRGQITQ